jgi:hypothetical protein
MSEMTTDYDARRVKDTDRIRHVPGIRPATGRNRVFHLDAIVGIGKNRMDSEAAISTA